jgi:pimeloyl-ACP methyl ester carboxylesterase
MKPPILIIHGACSQPGHLEPWRAFFSAAGYSCAVPALPGHVPDDPDALADLAMKHYLAAVREVRVDLHAPPIVVGHSLGGLVGQQLAATVPCAALVLVSSVPPEMLPVTMQAVPYLLPLAPRVFLGRPIKPGRAALEALTLHDLDKTERDTLLPGFGHESGRVFRSLVLGRIRADASRVRCPVLILHGEADRLVPISVGRRLARRYAADLLTVPGHGHWLVAESLIPDAAVPVLDWIAAQDENLIREADDPSFQSWADV